MSDQATKSHQGEDSSRPSEVDTGWRRAHRRGNVIDSQELGDSDFERPLAEELRDALVTSAFLYERFLPLGALDRLLTHNRVRRELERALYRPRPELAQQICDIRNIPDTTKTSRKKLFAIMVLIDRVEDVPKMIEAGLVDDDLPFELRTYATQFPFLVDKKLRRLAFCAHWDTATHINFCHTQWKVNAPYMKLQPYSEHNGKGRGPSHFVLRESDILPVTVCQRISNSFSGDIYKVQFHQDHHEVANADRANDKQQRFFALKNIRLYESFQSEQIALRKLTRSPHIVKPLGSIEYGPKTYLILPYAQGNLQNLWQKIFQDPNVARDVAIGRWMASQVLGLTKSLRDIHTCKLDQQGRVMKSPVAVSIAGIHGDIKPANILWFDATNLNDSRHGLGFLQVTYSGFSKLRAEGPPAPIAERGVTTMYRAPEYDMEGGMISQKSDTWSFSCVLIEFLTGYLCGYSALREFEESRKRTSYPGVLDKAYFNLEMRGRRPVKATTHSVVESHLQSMTELPHCPPFALDLIRYIKDHLLRINPRHRIAMEKFVPILESWSIRCSHDEFYVTGRQPSTMKHEERTSMTGSDQGVSDMAIPEAVRHSQSLSAKPQIDLSLDNSRHLRGNFEQQSDSGYGTFSAGRSLFHSEVDRTLIIYEEDPEQGEEDLACDSSIQSDTLDAITEFSDAESLVMRESFLAHKLIEKMRDDLGISAVDLATTTFLRGVLPRLFKGFAAELAQQTGSQLGRDVRYHVHKNKDLIISSLLEALCEDAKNDDHAEVYIDPNLQKARLDRASAWATETSAIAGNPTIDDTGSNETVSDDPEDEQSSETYDEGNHDLNTFSDILDNTRAYHWLLAMVKCEMLFDPTYPDRQSLIRTRILDRIPHYKVSRHRQSQTYEIIIQATWNPWAFFDSQGYNMLPQDAAANMVIVVGTETNAQATTCLEYMIQRWPMTGQNTMNCLVGLLKDGKSFSESVGTDGVSTICMSFLDGRVISTSRGTQGFVSEISEQLVWLESAMQYHNRADGVWLVESDLVYLSKQSAEEGVASGTTSHLRLNYETRIGWHSIEAMQEPGEGQCWHALFRSVQIVQGYPIRKRLEQENGLELSLDLMASLSQAHYLNIFHQTPMIKGFSTLLYPTRQSASSTTWHLSFNEDGSHISFMEGISCFTPPLDIPRIFQGRHILGWCRNAKSYAGAPNATYAVLYSMLPVAEAECLLGGASLHQGKLLKTDKFQLGTKDIPTRLGRLESDPYWKCLAWLHDQRAVLWDEDGKRGWLTSGVCALLHLLRAYIGFMSEGDFGAQFLLDGNSLTESIDTYSARAAIEVLMNEDNKNLRLFPQEPQQIKHQVAHFFNVLEQLFAYQGFVNKQCLMPENQASRTRLEGWDFSELVQEKDPVNARSTQIPAVGRSWIDFTRSMGALVLFGRGFGDLIQPEQPVSSCRWAQVPCDSYYLTALVRDIQGLGQIPCPRTGKLITRIGARFDLHTPSNMFEPCRCTIFQAEEHESYVQVVLPVGSSKVLHFGGPMNLPLSSHSGAIILGHNPAFSWIWKDFGPPETGNPLMFRDSASRATPQSDSGYLSQTSGSIRGRGYSAEPEVGIICALSKELTAVWSLMDCAEQRGVSGNPYVFGHLGGYSVVAACLPQGEYGTNAAAIATVHLTRSFPHLEFMLLVGIGGGIPSSLHDIRLGDVVVGLPTNPQEPGVVQYDAGKIHPDRFELKRSSLQPPPSYVKKVIATIKANPYPPAEPLDSYLRHVAQKCPKYAYPGAHKDVLYKPSDVPLLSCESQGAQGCKCTPQDRPSRPSTHPEIHYGSIASGNLVVKDADARDELARSHGVICVEMEAAGIANELQCLVIRGICDYADSHKNKIWQEYAAATAAAYAKYLLTEMNRSRSRRRWHKRTSSDGSSRDG